MQAARSNPFAPITWADDDHDSLTTDARGPLPAFDQFEELANGQTVRANRIPRVAAPRIGLCRRLHNAIKAHFVRRQLGAVRSRMDELQAQINEATETAIGLARLHRFSPELQAQRLALRLDHDEQFATWQRLRAELDALEAPL